MATIVMHTETETNYVLLGTGYGVWATAKPGAFGFADTKNGLESMAFVCNANGEIGGFRPDELVVVSIDGQAVSEVLNSPPASGLSI